MTSRRVLPRSIHSVFSSSYLRTYVGYVEDRPFERAFLLSRTTFRGSCNNIFLRVSSYRGYKLRENYRSISFLADFLLFRAPNIRISFRVYFFPFPFAVKRNLYESTRNLDLDRSKGAKLCGEIISRRKIKRKRKRKRKKKMSRFPAGGSSRIATIDRKFVESVEEVELRSCRVSRLYVNSTARYPS